MNEQHNQEPDIRLPQPVEQGPQSYAFEQQGAQAVEQDGVTAAPSQSPPQASAQPTNDSSAQATAAVPQPDPAAGSASPQIADDVDLIEKEWVERAKRIVEQTRKDPYQQSEQLHATKDDYQGKRFQRQTNPDSEL